MSRGKAEIQTDYVVEIITEVEVSQEDYVSDDLDFQIITINDFIPLFHKYHPQSKDNPREIWHNLFGNDPQGAPDQLNKEVQYLTKDSCQMLLGHYQLFKDSGIDFQHLPSGFFLTKNPHQGGVRDVLHYSDYLLTHSPQKNPLAVVLKPKSAGEAFEAEHGFVPPQSGWYEYLRNNISKDGITYCSEKELKNAFIAFSNTLMRLGLKFYPLLHVNHPANYRFNPITLLGRWETALTQPNLKKVDLERQWLQLPSLHFARGYGALRAILIIKIQNDLVVLS